LQRNSLWIRSRTCTYTILQTIRALASIKICTTLHVSMAIVAICSCQSEWKIQDKKIKTLHEEATEA
jgi:hypothetical protein